jgi:hypothetical protein
MIDKKGDNEMTHDPSEYIRGLQQLLISDKKKIAFLFGAGTSVAKKSVNSKYVPAVTEMTEMIENYIVSIDNGKYKNSIQEIKAELGNKYNIEIFLSNIEQKKQLIGNGKLNGLESLDFDKLIKTTKEKIKEAVGIHNIIVREDLLSELIHMDFAKWIARADRKFPIEIFTTNYDYLFELGLEGNGLPYYDGFTGSYRPFFDPGSIEDLSFLPNQTKLWKVHGSLGWHYDEKDKRVWRKDSDGEDILIYPSTLKYTDSKKQPYTALLDRLTNFIKQPDTILITCGYSFGDEHINERILTAINSNPATHVYALLYDIKKNGGKKDYLLTENSDAAKIAKKNRKISLYGCRSAVVGCKYGDWKLKKQPDREDTININLYFDEDAVVDETIAVGQQKIGSELWSGYGELVLPDFNRFVYFLNSMITSNESSSG